MSAHVLLSFQGHSELALETLDQKIAYKIFDKQIEYTVHTQK